MPKSLFLLTADKHMKACVEAVLGRSRSIGVRLSASDYDVAIESGHDSSVFGRGQESVRAYLRSHQYALLICDRHGSGGERLSRERMEERMEERLAQNGWQDRSAAIVIDPELENWIWADQRVVDAIFGWQGRQPSLREWLRLNDYMAEGESKPRHPKKCLENALAIVGRQKSAILFRQVAEQVNLTRCTDPAFLKLVSVLRQWFPAQ